jgi:hypothetical protein
VGTTVADIFISYSKQHPQPTRDLAAYLESQGYSVWWDTDLTPGQIFREVIDRELDAADAVIVIWTAHSVTSDWVISEAEHAARQKKLIPLRTKDLDTWRIPKPHNTRHTAVVDDREAILKAVRRIRQEAEASRLAEMESKHKQGVEARQPAEVEHFGETAEAKQRANRQQRTEDDERQQEYGSRKGALAAAIISACNIYATVSQAVRARARSLGALWAAGLVGLVLVGSGGIWLAKIDPAPSPPDAQAVPPPQAQTAPIRQVPAIQLPQESSTAAIPQKQSPLVNPNGKSTMGIERRVALVIGNSTYDAANISLATPKNDAEDVAAVLKSLGFEVETLTDGTKRDMDSALQRLARLATDADSALFFYAGHALQYQGRNFLMPTDARLKDWVSIRFETVALEVVNTALERVNGARIFILDAGRNNPLADRLPKTVASTRGLARIDKTQGTVVAYATAPDDVALDGQGRNSPFTAALLKRLQEPGLEIGMMFRRVASDVNAETGGRQRPESYISLLSSYYLNQSDRIVWDRIKDQDDPKALRDFINKFPTSPNASLARAKLDGLENASKKAR